MSWVGHRTKWFLGPAFSALDSLNPCPTAQGYTEVPPEVTLTACAGGFLRGPGLGLGEQPKDPLPT